MTKNTPQPSIAHRARAKYIAAVVRNAMETFHSKHLTDAQMKVLNPIIRNAICTALDAEVRAEKSKAANSWAASQLRFIRPYWEEPELLDDYVDALRLYQKKQMELRALRAKSRREATNDQSVPHPPRSR